MERKRTKKGNERNGKERKKERKNHKIEQKKRGPKNQNIEKREGLKHKNKKKKNKKGKGTRRGKGGGGGGGQLCFRVSLSPQAKVSLFFFRKENPENPIAHSSSSLLGFLHGSNRVIGVLYLVWGFFLPVLLEPTSSPFWVCSQSSSTSRFPFQGFILGPQPPNRILVRVGRGWFRNQLLAEQPRNVTLTLLLSTPPPEPPPSHPIFFRPNFRTFLGERHLGRGLGSKKSLNPKQEFQNTR